MFAGTAGGVAVLNDVPGIDAVNDFGQMQEVRVKTNPQQFLQSLATRTTIYHFEVTRPSLQDIFVRIAKPELAGQELAGLAAT